MTAPDSCMASGFFKAVVGLLYIWPWDGGVTRARRLRRQDHRQIWEFPKIRDTLFGGPYNKDPTI